MNLKAVLLVVLAAVLIVVMVACVPASGADEKYTIVDNEGNQLNKNLATKDEVIKKTSDSITNLKNYLTSSTVADTGYYMELDFDVDTDTGDNFELKFRGNLYTYPYQIKDENGNVIGEDEDAKAIHNEVIKKSDLLIEWYNGHTNELMIGFYFDGVNASKENPGNHLYLNLRGYKRWYRDFGNTVMFQQIMRLITNLDVELILSQNDSSIDDGITTFAWYLSNAVNDNYQQTINGATTTLFYENIALDVIAPDVTKAIHGIFSPFEDKIDPLTNKYLGFKFSTLGQVQINTLNADLSFDVEPDISETLDVLCGVDAKMRGSALSYGVSVPFRSNATIRYSTRVSNDIRFDLAGYVEFIHGQYDFTALLDIPLFNLRYEGEIITSLTEKDNTLNKIDARFRNLSTQEYAVMGFYRDEKIYINTEGVEDIYGAIQLDELGFPKVFYEGIDLSELLRSFYDTVNNGMVSIVDALLDPETYQGEGVEEGLIRAIMSKMRSEGDTMTLTVDVELVKEVLRYTQKVDPSVESPYYTLDDKGRPIYTTKGLVMLLSDWVGYDMEQIAAIFGVASAEVLLERSWFEITYNVETNHIIVELYTSVRVDRALVFRLTLIPVKFGEEVVFPTELEDWDSYKPLLEVQTLSATLNGDIRFASNAEIDLSKMLGSFIDDRSGLNTVYRSAPNARILFTLVFDQYIQYTDPEGNDNLQFILGELEENGVDVDIDDLVGQMRGRMAFYLSMTVESNRGEELIARLYAYNVSFNQEVYDRIEAGEDVPEGYGYVYVDLTGGLNPGRTDIPLMRIREDYFMHSFFDYAGKTDAANSAATLSIYSILMAILEDATFYTTDDAISITTSNRILQRIFGIDDLVANFQAQIGFRSRVKDQYSVITMVDRFADYEVGELTDLEVAGVYDGTVPIHHAMTVEFKWRSGDVLTKILKFKYYKETMPVRDDFYNDEEYQAALDKYNAYASSVHNIDIIPDKDRYFPSVDGTFMGAERNYALVVNGGSNQRNATARIESLYETEFRWEPFEEKPSSIRAVNSNNGLVMSYSADFSIDWNAVTVDGLGRAYYTVTVGPGSLGEFTAEVAISVINRRVVNGDGSQADVVYVYNGGTEVSAPVAATLTIDPYDYIVSRYSSSSRNVDGVFITDYLKTRAPQVTLNFAGGDSERGFFDWFFDDADGVGNNRETAINERGGKLYLHTSFHNQIIALELIVKERIVDHITIIGEEAPDTYTVDVLDRSTYTLPVRPTVYFGDDADGVVSRVFAFDFIWSYAAVDNVTMNGAPLVNGQPSPFNGHIGNTVSAYLDIERAFGIGEWFGKQIVTLKVETPPKIISELYDVSAKNAVGAAEEPVKAVSIGVKGTRETGYWFVDDRYESSYTLPDTVTAYFEDGSSKDYKVAWDTSTGLVLKTANGYTVTRNVQGNSAAEFYYVNASLDDVYEFRTVIVKLPYRGTDISVNVWYGRDGDEDIKLNVTETGGKYLYRVNPYDDVFLTPNIIEEVFDDENGVVIGTKDGVPHYFRNKYRIEPSVAGLEYTYVLGEGNSSVEVIVEVSGDGTVAQSIEFLNAGVTAGSGRQTVAEDSPVTMEVSAPTDGVRRVLIDGIAVPANGVVVLGGVNYTARSLVLMLLSNVKITMADGQEKIRDPEIVNFNGVFDAADLQNGISVTLRMSIVPAILDYEVIITGHLADGGHPDVVNKTVTLQPFDSDPENGNRYENGYSLTTHRVEFEDGTSQTFADWYVGAFNGVEGLAVGQIIRTITPEMLLAKYPAGSEVNVTVYTFREDDTKISVRFNIPTLDWTKFQSVGDGEFVIKDGGIVVDDMYSVDLSSIRGVLDRLPTTVRFYNIEVNNVRWRAAEGAEDNLAALDYRGGNFALATATVNAGGEFDVTLYVRFENCEANGISGFDGVISDGNGNLTATVELDPYSENASGIYRLAEELTLRFSSRRTHTFYDVAYAFSGDASANRVIPYIYSGFSDGIISGNERRYVVDIGFGQTVTFVITLLDRTFKTYNFEIGEQTATVTDFRTEAADGTVFSTVDKSGETLTYSVYIIDPYRVLAGEGYLPREIIASAFANGAALEAYTLPVIWTTDIRVDYEGSAITVVEGYVDGMGNQPLSFVVEVRQRPANAYNVVLYEDETTPATGYTDGNNAGAGIYNFRTEQSFRPDPFVYGEENLPKYAMITAKEGAPEEITVPIDWVIEAGTFNVSGGTALVHGYLVAEGVGHHITLTVIFDEWTFVRIARPVSTNGTDDYTAWTYSDMSPICFTFVSLLTENGYFEMTDRAFRVTFRKTDASGASTYEYKYFVPEAYADSDELKIYFNDDAIRQAVQSASRGTASSFYLGADGKARMHVTGNITYFAEAPIIETDTVVYYYSTSDGAQYLPYILIDPLNPSLPVKAYSYTNWSPDRLVEWTITSTAEFATVNLNSYLGGGVLRGKNFVFTLKDENGNNVLDQNGNSITQAVPVDFLFLDRTVSAGTETGSVTLGGETRKTVSVSFKDAFDAYTYVGKPNPYGSYAEVIDALNAAVSIYGNTATVEIIYDVDADGNETFREFSVGGRVYKKDMFGDAPIIWQ